MDLFVACFWGHDPLRIKYAQEFILREPRVTLLQNGHYIIAKNTVHFDLPEDGFIDYKMINAYIQGKDINTLTIFDTDLILPEDIYELIINSHFDHKVPHFTTFKRAYQLVNDVLVETGYSKVYTREEGFTGYVLSFNKHFLEKYKFNENFVYGGYDYFLVCSMLRKCMYHFQKEFNKVPITKCDVIDVDVVHKWHSKDRVVNWNLYKDTLGIDYTI